MEGVKQEPYVFDPTSERREKITSNSLKIAEATLNSSRSTSTASTSSSTLPVAPKASTKDLRSQKQVEKRRAQNKAYYERRKAKGEFYQLKSIEQKERIRAGNRSCYHRRKAELKRLETKEAKEIKLTLSKVDCHKRKETTNQITSNSLKIAESTSYSSSSISTSSLTLTVEGTEKVPTKKSPSNSRAQVPLKKSPFNTTTLSSSPLSPSSVTQITPKIPSIDNLLMLAEVAINSSRSNEVKMNQELSVACNATEIETTAPTKMSPAQIHHKKRWAQMKAYYEQRKAMGVFEKVKSEEEKEREQFIKKGSYHRIKELQSKEEKERKLAMRRAYYHFRKEKGQL
ncbi:unnamed protein product [Orchesella dallaii]|uniref:Uncharacterized protein n=1 Tax=Orchesella dallaii TaxID=48710 RepID=A0ABP1R6F3_9HEXA